MSLYCFDCQLGSVCTWVGGWCRGESSLVSAQCSVEAQYSFCCLKSSDDVVRDKFEERHRAGLVEGRAVSRELAGGLGLLVAEEPLVLLLVNVVTGQQEVDDVTEDSFLVERVGAHLAHGSQETGVTIGPGEHPHVVLHGFVHLGPDRGGPGPRK